MNKQTLLENDRCQGWWELEQGGQKVPIFTFKINKHLGMETQYDDYS